MVSDARKRDDLLEKALNWYDKAAKQGHIPAKVGYAKMLLEDPTNDNVTNALKIYEEADKAADKMLRALSTELGITLRDK